MADFCIDRDKCISDLRGYRASAIHKNRKYDMYPRLSVIKAIDTCIGIVERQNNANGTTEYELKDNTQYQCKTCHAMFDSAKMHDLRPVFCHMCGRLIANRQKILSNNEKGI